MTTLNQSPKVAGSYYMWAVGTTGSCELYSYASDWHLGKNLVDTEYCDEKY